MQVGKNHEKLELKPTGFEFIFPLGVAMILSRNYIMIFLSIYLPTILMNIINQASNYISSEDKYSMIYTINITCMMVLASVYLSVSASLPTTLRMKPVEIWLLSNLSYPVLVILVNVLLQVKKGCSF